MSPAIWFLAVRAGSGADVFTQRLCDELNKQGIRSEISWLPLRVEYAPWMVPVPQPPAWATVLHINTWLPLRFLPKHLPIVATLHHAVHHPDAKAYKGIVRAAYHRFWIAPNERRVLRRADRVVAVSKFAAETAKQTLEDVPMKVIYNGIDTERFTPGSRRFPAGEPFRLLYVGNWTTLKGVDLLAPIMRELNEGFELRYTGSPAERDMKNMPANMHNIGWLESEQAVIAAMQDADALLFPSRSEGFGLVAVEAMAAGLPVIAAHNSALSEIVDDGITGFLCPLDNVVAFAEVIRRLAKDSTLRQKIVKAAHIRVEQDFEMNAMVGRYVEIYRQIV